MTQLDLFEPINFNPQSQSKLLESYGLTTDRIQDELQLELHKKQYADIERALEKTPDDSYLMDQLAAVGSIIANFEDAVGSGIETPTNTCNCKSRILKNV